MINREIVYERNLTGSFMKIAAGIHAGLDEKLMLRRKLMRRRRMLRRRLRRRLKRLQFQISVRASRTSLKSRVQLTTLLSLSRIEKIHDAGNYSEWAADYRSDY